MPVLPFQPFAPDVSDLSGQSVALLRNVVPRLDGYGPMRGTNPFTSALPSQCRGYYCARLTDGTVRIFAGTADRLWSLNNTTLAWEDVSKDGTAYATLANDVNWVFAQFNNLVFATQRGVDMQVFNLASDSEFDELEGDPPRAGWVSVVGRFLVAADLASNPFRIHWSGLNEVTNWASGTNSSDYQDLPDGGRPLAVLEPVGDVGIILQETGARRMVFSPGSEVVFQIDRLQDAPGVLAQYSAVTIGGGVFYASTRGIVLVSADGSLTPIGEERVNRTFLGQLPSTAPALLQELAYDSSNPQLVVSVADPANSLVLLGYKSLASAAVGMDKGLVYHTTLKRWAPVDISAEYISTAARPGLTLEALDALAPGALVISGAADNGAGLIRITVSSTSALTTGDYKTISGVTGTTEANGTWPITVIDGTHFDLQGSTFSNDYVSGGIVGGSMDALSFSLDSISTATLRNVSAVDTAHKLGFFDGSTLEAELFTSEQSLSGKRIEVNGLRPVTNAQVAFCSTVTRDRIGAASTTNTEAEMDADGFCGLLDEGRYVRGRLRIPSATSWSFASGLEPYTGEAGEL